MALLSTEIEKVFHRFSEALPEPSTELYYTNNFTLAVAVVLSARATDVKVNSVTHGLFQVLNDPWDVLKFGLENLQDSVKSIGLYKSKAKNIFLMSQKLIDEKNGVLPSDFDYLLTLPGIGRKSANVILNTAFGLPTIAVDTHVKRVSNRLGFVNTNNFLKIELELSATIPTSLKNKAHHWLVLHGRYICKARKPLCGSCIVKDLCKFLNKTQG